jgi:hypothetical protein
LAAPAWVGLAWVAQAWAAPVRAPAALALRRWGAALAWEAPEW